MKSAERVVNSEKSKSFHRRWWLVVAEKAWNPARVAEKSLVAKLNRGPAGKCEHFWSIKGHDKEI